MHLIIFGILLGVGVAAPIGPVNLEIIRRTLRFGTPYGIALGLGACAADLTYLVLLCLGALGLLQHPDVLRVLGIVGSLILGWFGIVAIRSEAHETVSHPTKKPSLTRYAIEGCAITLINPFTILFWLSISSQLSLMAMQNSHAVYYAGLGVILGTVGWVMTLNGLVHFTRHKLTPSIIRALNYTGGIILIGFAIYGLLKACGLTH